MKPDRIILDDLLAMETDSEKFVSIMTRIDAGAVFIYPTETIYGIGGIATTAVKRKICRIKKRPPDEPLILIAGDIGVFSGLDLVFNNKAQLLADTFWPGDLTLILPASSSEQRVSVRVSDHPFIQLVAEHVREPLYSTSANMSGETYINNPDIIYDLFSKKIEMMIDGGVLPESLPSTVVDTCGEEIVILREGVVPTKRIMTVAQG